MDIKELQNKVINFRRDEPQANEMLDRERMRITRLEATPKSVIR